MIKCVITDLDGTLLNKGRLSENNYAAIKLLLGKGIRFIAATGRPEPLAEIFMKDLGFKCNRIIMNGACYINEEGEALFKNSFTSEELKESIEIITSLGASGMFNALEDSYSLWTPEELRKISKPLMEAYGFDDIDYDFPGEMILCTKEELAEKEIMKIELTFGDMELREKCRNELSKIEGLTVSSALPFNLEINTTSCNKGVAVRKICEIYGYQPDEVACFGDSENDIPMLEQVYYSYAMADADEAVRNSATFVCEACADDGFHKQVMRLVEMQ